MEATRYLGWLIICLLTSLGCVRADLTEKAATLVKEGRPLEAVETLREVIDSDPDNPEAQFLYGHALILSGQWPLAEWPLRRAMRSPEWRTRAGLKIADWAVQSGNPEAAIEPLTTILDHEPDRIDALLARANAFAATRTAIDEALEDVGRVRDMEPENLESYRPEILAYLAAGRADDASVALSELGERLEEELAGEDFKEWYCTTMALFAEESGETELASTRWLECAEGFPAVPGVVLQAIQFFEKQGESDRAHSILERAVEKSDSAIYHGFRTRLAFRHAANGRVSLGESLLVKGSQLDDPVVSGRYVADLVQFYDQLNRVDQAYEVAQKALAGVRDSGQRNPSQEIAVADLAIRAGELDDALVIADEISVTAFAHLIRARVAQANGDLEEALAGFEAAATLWPDNEYTRYHAARAAEALGQFDRAIELYRHATRINNSSTDAQTRIARLALAEGRPAAALELLNIQAARGPLGVDGDLLRLELIARLSNLDDLPARVETLVREHPAAAPRVVTRALKGLRLRGASSMAMSYLENIRPEVFLVPGGGEILRELIRNAGEGRDYERLEAVLQVALKRVPNSAELHTAQGYLREVQDSRDEARVLYGRALELDNQQAAALVGIARIEGRHEPTAAAERGVKALDLPDVNYEEVLELGRLLVTESGNDPVIRLFEELLKRSPAEGFAATILSRQLMLKGDHSDRTLDFAKRAARFPPSADTLGLLRDVYIARGEQGHAKSIAKVLAMLDEPHEGTAEVTEPVAVGRVGSEKS